MLLLYRLYSTTIYTLHQSKIISKLIYMRKERNLTVLETSDLKILETVSLLNKEQYYPLSEGVYRILVGDDDEDIEKFSYLSTYKTLVSFNQKKISRLIVMLLRYHYLERVYDPDSDKLYLKIAPLGETELVKYHKKHKYKFSTKKVKKKPCIVKLENVK